MPLRPNRHHAAPAPHDAGVLPLHRLEGFSDAVFAFAVTLLVVSLEVPKSATELFGAMRGFAGFGICFLFLAFTWVEHAQFFKRFPITDALTVALNLLLLFVLLLYVYPLKFLFSVLSDQLLWGQTARSIDSLAELRELMIVYGLGFLTLNLVFIGMRLNAQRQVRRRFPSGLAGADQVHQRIDLLRNGAMAGIALASVLIAAYMRDDGSYSGMIYVLLLPVAVLLRAYKRRLLRALPRAGHAAP